MIDPHNFYFYIIFLSQILLASWFIPNKILLRMKTVMETYPPEEYPKLYSGTIDHYNKTQHKYKLLNSIMLTVGFSFMSAIVMWDYMSTGQISEMIPWLYFMLQMVPLLWLEVKECKYFRAMRNNNSSTTKTAVMTPRKLLDFISFKLLVSTIALMVMAFILVLVKYGFSGKSFENIIIILATNLFFAGVIYWHIYGKKQDPYQASEDRIKQIKVTVHSMVYVSIGVSIFLGVHMLIKIYDISYIKPSVMSIYCQLILWASVGNRLKQLKLENIDFSVYKEQAEINTAGVIK